MASPAPTRAPTQAPVPRPVGAPPQARPAPPTAPRASRLGAAKRERLHVPMFYLWYGPEGVGKTGLIADMPDPLMIDIEGGSAEIEIARYPFRDEPGGYIPRSYEDVLGAVEDLIANPGHGYRTLGLDTADALEGLLHTYICKRDCEPNVEGYGFGKGYKVAVAEFRLLLSRLNVLRHRDGMNIAFAAHAKAKTFKNPEGPDYDRWQIVGDDLFTAELRGRCDNVGFIHFEGGGAKLADEGKSKSARARGWDTGRRLIELVRTAAWDAKTRLAVPAQIELAAAHPFAPFASAKLAAQDATIESLTAEVLVELERITGGNRDLEFTTSSGKTTTGSALLALPDLDVTALGRILGGLKSTAPVTATKES
jgi:hypothetical protein